MSLSSTASRFFTRLLSVGADPADSPDLRQRKRLMVGVMWGIVFLDVIADVIILPLLVAQGAPLQLPASLTLTILVFLGVLASLYLRPALFSICVHVLCSFVMLNILSIALLLGGIITGLSVLVLGLMVPILALLMYDLWGDAVNTASRMESHGAGGSIQITEATHELIKDDFICEAHGTINIKGKGEMKVWYVLDKKA